MSPALDKPLPGIVDGSFIALVVILAGFLLFAVRYVATLRGKDSGGANRIATITAVSLGLWLSLTGILSLTGFFARFETIPPRFLLGVLPAIAAVLFLVSFHRTREWLTALPEAWVIGFQAFRIPVELVLWALAHHSIVPNAMTFEGRNFDILTGLTAPLVAYFGIVRGRWPRWAIIAWNAMGLFLLFNVVRVAILAAPGPFRQLTEEAPNLAPSLFPFIWLPYFLVPLALLGHLVSLAQVAQSAKVAASKTPTTSPTPNTV
jgi:hypothetical protein